MFTAEIAASQNESDTDRDSDSDTDTDMKASLQDAQENKPTRWTHNCSSITTDYF